MCMYGNFRESIKRETLIQCCTVRLAITHYPTAKQVNLAFSLVVGSVLQKNEHRLEDRRLPRYYPLKVTAYCENVSSS